jgi:lipopolysaccharide/colanic/teichoic acid biosynthesis glycosyltransferase
MLMPADSSASTAFREQAVVRAHFQGSLNGNGEVAEGATAAWKMVIRRGLNVTVAVVALLILLPFMFLVAVLIRLTSPGPILYTQPRVGVDRRNDRGRPDGRRVVDHGGRLFRIYKFRTMYVNADFGGQRWASPDDPRVTPLGRILRRYRLDELPQIWNVLVGDMNLVGPRPEQPRIFAELRGQIPGYVRRQRVLPGITGLAQINQSYDRCVEDVRRKVNYDLEYIERVSPLQDLRILLATLPAVVVKRGGW